MIVQNHTIAEHNPRFHSINGGVYIKYAAYLLLGISLLLAFSLAKAQSNYFDYAKIQIKKYNPPRQNVAIVIDYTKNILSDRLFVLDLIHGKVLISSRVSHAWHSGLLYPKKFSNQKGSEMSSRGNYVTGAQIVSPKFGIAMLVTGLDAGLNSNARSREIIFHSDANMKSKWSNGCFATPDTVNKKIINLTKNGVLVCVIAG